MTRVTQPIAVPGKPDQGPFDARARLDALSTGACDQSVFLKEVNEVLRSEPDEGWELLSLIDQYYRRGKLHADLFRSLNAHLQASLMGTARSGAERSPTPPAGVRAAADPAPPDALNGRSTPPRFMSPAAAATDSSMAVTPAGATVQSTSSRPAAEAGHAPAVGELLRHRYRILGVLGQGAIGTVFEALDEFRADMPGESRKVAVKVLHPAIAQRAELLAELRREFQHLQSLSHPNIVRVHEFDRDGSTAFFTMECLGGSLLSRVLAVREASPLFRPHALKVLRDVGGALSHAHARGVMHGDLDPGNIFVTDGGDLRVLNFGTSYKLHRGPWVSQTDSAQDFADAASIYASCQVLEGEPAEARDDLYAFGCIAYFLLTGAHPYQQYTALKARTLRLTPERPGGLARRQWQALRAALSFERELRPTSMQEWLEHFDLRGGVQRLPTLPVLMTAREHRRHGWWIGTAAAAAVVLLGIFGWWAAQHTDQVRPEAQALADRVQPLFASARHAVAVSWDKARRADSKTAPQSPGEPAPPVARQPARVPPATTHLPSRSTAPRAVAAPGTAPVISPTHPSPAATAEPRAAAPPETATSPAATPPATLPSAALVAAPPLPSAPAASTLPQSATSAPMTLPPVGAGKAPGRPGSPDAPHSRIELVADTVEAVPGEPVARVAVRRIGSWRGAVTFTWWTESGTAKPQRDFVAVKPQPEELGDGKGLITLAVPLIVDAARTTDRSFYVVIDDASPNATLGSRTLTLVTIPAPP